MKKKSFHELPCPIGRSLDVVGEWWSILILRDALYGLTRFEEFEKSLRIAPNILIRRLNALVEEGLLERRLYRQKPPRYEYLLTQRGHDFRSVILAMLVWGNKHYSREGERIVLLNAETGAPIEAVWVDGANGNKISETQHVFAPGPAAEGDFLKKMELASVRQQQNFPPAATTPCD